MKHSTRKQINQTKLNKQHYCLGRPLTFSAGAAMLLIAVCSVVASNTIYNAHAAGIAYTITYETGVTSNMPADVDSKTLSETVSISSNTPTRKGFTFNGWCNGTVTTTDDIDSCSGTQYATGSNYILDQVGGVNNLSLIAMWQKATQSSCPTSPKISAVASGINYMQDINSSNRVTVLASLTEDATYQIKDNRDNETYCVSKLKDGKLWLLDNLALDLTDSTILNSLSSTNTNIDSNNEAAILTSLKSGNRGAGNQYANGSIGNLTEGNTYSVARVNLNYKDDIPTDATSQAGGYKIGGFYNYCAASAGSYCYGDGTNYGSSNGNATSSICPAGWIMPTGDSISGEYQALYNNANYNTYANYRAALHLPLSGYFTNKQAVKNISGGWWSSSRSYYPSVYTLGSDRSAISAASVSNRLSGLSVRCILSS